MLKADVTNVKNENNRSHIVNIFQLDLCARYFVQCERYHGVKLFCAAKLLLKKGICIKSEPFFLNKITFSKTSQSKAGSTSGLKDSLIKMLVKDRQPLNAPKPMNGTPHLPVVPHEAVPEVSKK